MIILDSNVVSEAMKSGPNQAVVAWIDAQAIETLFLTATSLSELLSGIEVLPDGHRRSLLRETCRTSLERLFGSRILSFDTKAALAYAAIFAQTRSSGFAIGVGDGQIAAIAHVHGYTVATRDTGPFLAADVPVIDPWNL